jgi:prevent-host-death family protein
MIKVSLAEAKNRLTELVREAEAGKEVMILKHRKPAVRLISEEEYQRLKRSSAVSGLRRLRERFRAAGMGYGELFRAGRESLEKRA